MSQRSGQSATVSIMFSFMLLLDHIKANCYGKIIFIWRSVHDKAAGLLLPFSLSPLCRLSPI